jgi:flagellar biosynthesis activator protein FlaF
VNAELRTFGAYARPDAPVRAPRTIEYDLFARVTRQVSAAFAGRERDHAGLVRALHDNSQLWRTLAADVAGSGNGLPQDLRARLFYLYEFTEAHSRKVLDGTAEVGVLVEINTSVMRGLRGAGGSAA